MKLDIDNKFTFIAFLDVLGWSDSTDYTNDIQKLNELIQTAIAHIDFAVNNRNTLDKLYDTIVKIDQLCPIEVNKSGIMKLKEKAIDFKNIYIQYFADSICLLFPFKENADKPDIDRHFRVYGEIIQNLFVSAIKLGFPLRGTIACGKMSSLGCLFAGKPFYETKIHHDSTNWIGCHLLPSAEKYLHGYNKYWVQYNKVPFKKEKEGRAYALSFNGTEYLELLQTHYGNLKNLNLEVTLKYQNTFHFIEYIQTYEAPTLEIKVKE